MEEHQGTAVAAGRQVYETKVGVEAVIRSGGKNPQLKGVVHEVLYRDRITANPANLITNTKGTLSKSVTAVRDDVLTMRGGKVVGRAQLKDTISSSGLRKTIKQASSGKYSGTKLMGTKETARAYNAAAEKLAQSGAKAPQAMKSTGISSADTSRIAGQTIGGQLTASALGKVAATSGGAGAVLSGGIEVIASGVKLAHGEIEGGKFVANVAKETAGGGLSAAAGSVAATAAATCTASLLAATSAPLWIPGAVGIGAAVVVGSGIKSLWDALWD